MGRIGVVALLTFLVVQVYAAQPILAQVEGPRVVLSVDPKTSQRTVQLMGQVYPTIDITCDGKRWSVPAIEARTVATYAVPEDAAETMLKAVECRLLIPGREIVLPRPQMWAAWASPSKGTGAPKILQARVLEVVDVRRIAPPRW